jgi:predicted nucleotidyltransferase
MMAVEIDALRSALLPMWQTRQFRLIVLFGSTARGTASARSDLDLAVLPAEGAAEMDVVHVTAEVVRLTHHNEVDVVDLRRADPLLAMQIAESGRLLYAHDPSEFTEFRSLAFRRYVDTEKLRRAQQRALDLFQQRHEPH